MSIDVYRVQLLLALGMRASVLIQSVALITSCSRLPINICYFTKSYNLEMAALCIIVETPILMNYLSVFSRFDGLYLFSIRLLGAITFICFRLTRKKVCEFFLSFLNNFRLFLKYKRNKPVRYLCQYVDIMKHYSRYPPVSCGKENDSQQKPHYFRFSHHAKRRCRRNKVEFRNATPTRFTFTLFFSAARRESAQAPDLITNQGVNLHRRPCGIHIHRRKHHLIAVSRDCLLGYPLNRRGKQNPLEYEQYGCGNNSKQSLTVSVI